MSELKENPGYPAQAYAVNPYEVKMFLNIYPSLFKKGKAILKMAKLVSNAA